MPEYVDVFADLAGKAWPFTFRVTLAVPFLAGGVPSDPAVAESWIRNKLGDRTDQQIMILVAETMLDRGITQEEAIKEVNRLKHTTGFKRDPDRGMYIEGRTVKAMIKEAASIAVATPEVASYVKLSLKGWGTTGKWLNAYLAEHFFVEEDRIYLRDAVTEQPLHEPSEIRQSFPKNARVGQTGIQYTEIAHDVLVTFTVKTDHPWTREEIGMIFLTGAENGLGAQRSQQMGRYTVVEFTQLTGPAIKADGRSSKAPAAKPAGKGRKAAVVTADDDGGSELDD